MTVQSQVLSFFLVILIAFGTSACASYPDEPRKPEAAADNYSVEEDGFLSVAVKDGILANDIAGEGAKPILKTAGELTTTGGGVVILADDGSFTYEPRENFNGEDRLAYTIENEKGKSSDGEIVIEVVGVNDPPLPADDTADTPQGQAVILDVLGNDEDPDGDALRLVGLEQPSNGTARPMNGQVEYIPPANHSGPEIFYYIVSDGNGEEARGRVTVTIESNGSGFQLVADGMSVEEDTSETLLLSTLLLNDDVPAQEELVIDSLGAAQHGTVNQVSDDSLIYTPEENYFGPDTFTYTVRGQSGHSASSMVNVTVIPMNDRPTVSPIEDLTLHPRETSDFIPFVVNDIDNDVSSLSVSYRISDADPRNLSPAEILFFGERNYRALRIQTRPILTGNFRVDIFADDGEEVSNVSSFMVTVVSPFTPTDTDTDDGSETDTESGTDTDTGTESETETDQETDGDPETDSSTDTTGETETEDDTDDTDDGDNREEDADEGDEEEGEDDVERDPEDSIPTISTSSPQLSLLTSSRSSMVYKTSEDAPVTITADRGLLSNNIGSAGPLSRLVSTGAFTSQYGGNVQMAVNGGFTYRPPANFTGQDFFQYITISGNDSPLVFSSKVFIQVTPVNDPPLALRDRYVVLPGKALVVNAAQGVLANDRDVEDKPLRVIVQNRAGLNLRSDGGFTFAPDSDFIDRKVFFYTVSDGDRRASASLIFVRGRHLPPVVINETYLTATGQSLTINAERGLLSNDRDPEGVPVKLAETGIFDTLFGGEVNLRNDGGFTYHPPSRFNGFDSFHYTVTDGQHPVVGIAGISVGP